MPECAGSSKTVRRYSGRVELLFGWHGSLLEQHAVSLMKRGVNMLREMQEFTLMSM